MKQKKRKSEEALRFDEEIKAWRGNALLNSKQPWLEDVLEAMAYFKKGDYYKVSECFNWAARRPSNEKEFFIKAAKEIRKLEDIRSELFRKVREHEVPYSHLDENFNQIKEVTSALENYIYEISNQINKHQGSVFNHEFQRLRADNIRETIKAEDKYQSEFYYNRYPVTNALKKYDNLESIVNKLYHFDKWADLKYIEVTGAYLLKLKQNKELSNLIKNSVVDLSRIGGLVSHNQQIISVIRNVLGNSYTIDCPLILLKSHFTVDTLVHELTHACIKSIDFYLHELGSLGNYPYEDIPEERLAFISEVLVHQWLYPKDTREDFLKSQAKMNIEEDQLNNFIEAHIKIKKEIWDFIKNRGRVKNYNILYFRDAAVNEFIAPLLNLKKYTLLSQSNPDVNKMLSDAFDGLIKKDYKTAYELYNKILKIKPELQNLVKKRLDSFEHLFMQKKTYDLNHFEVPIDEKEIEKPDKFVEEPIKYLPTKSKSLKNRLFEIKKFINILFTPRWKHPDPQVRMYWAESFSDKKILATMAKNDQDSRVRLISIKGIIDQEVLMDIAKKDEDFQVRKAAIRKILNQEFLIQIAKNDKHETVRDIATQKITDQNVLQQIAVYDQCSDVRCTAIRKIEEQLFLERIAMTDKQPKVRKIATQKVTEKKVLESIANNDQNSDVRNAAIERIEDPSILDNIILKENFNPEGNTALTKVTNKKVLADFAKKNHTLCGLDAAIRSESNEVLIDNLKNLKNNVDLKYASSVILNLVNEMVKTNDTSHLADISNIHYWKLYDENHFIESSLINLLNLIHDQQVIFDIALNSKSFSISKEALLKLTDPDLLLKIILNCEDKLIAKEALSKISGQELLSTIVLNCSDLSIVKEALRIITDQAILSEILFNSNDKIIIKETLSKITDPEVLFKIVLNCGELSISKEALSKITDQELLFKIVIDCKNYLISKEALSKINEPKLIAKIAAKSQHVSKEAFERVTDFNLLFYVAENTSFEAIELLALKKLGMEKDELFKKWKNQ